MGPDRSCPLGVVESVRFVRRNHSNARIDYADGADLEIGSALFCLGIAPRISIEELDASGASSFGIPMPGKSASSPSGFDNWDRITVAVITLFACDQGRLQFATPPPLCNSSILIYNPRPFFAIDKEIDCTPHHRSITR